MELFAIDDNPVPTGGAVGSVTTADGVTLRFASWPAEGNRTHGTVAVLPGRGEAIEKYFETIGDLRRRGFAVAALDWRGQGGSERRLRNPAKAHVDSFAEYDRDLEAFTQQVLLPDCPAPYFALAHSTGGLVALRAARDGRARFTRMVVLAPLVDFGPTRPPQPVASNIATLMTALGLGDVSAPGQAAETIQVLSFEGNKLTGDRGRFELSKRLALALPDVFVRGPTFGWLYAAFRAVRELSGPPWQSSFHVPVLMVVGALDRVVSVAAIERLAAKIRGAGVIVIPGGQHELLLERNIIREQVFAAIDAFIPGAN